MNRLWYPFVWLVFRDWALSAIKLDSLNISFSATASEDCQKCLLQYAGANHMEQIQSSMKQSAIYLSFWAVGAPQFFTRNLMSCLGYQLCSRFDFTKTNAVIMTDGISGELSLPSAYYESYEVKPSSNDQIPVNLYNAQKKRDTGIPPDSDPAHITILTPGRCVYTQQRLYRNTNSASALCEACIKKASELGRIEKYFLYQKHLSIVYVIYAQGLNQFKKACLTSGVCKCPTALLEKDLCDLFRFRASSPLFQRRNSDKVPGVEEPYIEISTSNSIWSEDRRRIQTFLAMILMQSFCIVIQ
uniref:AlNc14C34G3106 protein n=1 Tax=Albugo laibachii Nc14 TaxID=890382 RepID=F0W8I0_9STRA|nr:AlNc14C34G3106 [Albugo laibachii Nc14]CCA26854.1 AlNc14C422G11537 [Albugo laibachii Nc14]|eukprot:CCA26854.1 AlNc14C422G11537 [Albugo laibachii Nc14]